MSDDKTTDVVDIPCESLPVFQRNNYFYGKLLTVNDFQIEQQYFVNKQRLANRLIHGTGVVCGLQVTQNGDSKITISPGVALDYCGREIVVTAPYDFDLQLNLPSGATTKVNIYIKYDSCGLNSLTRILKSSNCKDDCCYGTIKEQFKVEAQIPKIVKPTPDTICADWDNYLKDSKNDKFCLEACSTASEDGVLLAEVSFTVTNGAVKITPPILNDRDIVFGNKTLYRLIECLKNQAELNPPKIEKIDWKHNETFTDIEKWLARLFTESGFNITFDRPMDTSTINDSTVSLTLECYSKQTSLPIYEKKEIVIKPRSTTLNTKKTNVQIILDRLNFMERGYQYFALDGILENYSRLRLRFQVKGDFVCDTKGKCLDGDFLRGKLPTGDGIEGGLFESWINLKLPIETTMIFQAAPDKVIFGEETTFTASISPAPPTSIDAYHGVALTYTDPAGNLVQQGTFNSDAKGIITIAPIKLPAIGKYTMQLSYPGETFSSTGDTYKPISAQQIVTVSPPLFMAVDTINR